MDDIIKTIWEEQNHVWLSTRHEILRVLGVRMPPKQVYDIVNDITDADRLAPCGKEMIFTRMDRGYQFCRNNCACGTTARLKSTAITNIERYGVASPLSDPEIRAKARRTMVEKYGSEYALQNSESLTKFHKSIKMLDQDAIVEKRKTTMLERYGEDNSLKVKEFRDRVQDTMQERYGGRTTLTSPILKEKVKKTNLERYGKEEVLSSKIVRDRIKDVIQERYGVDEILKSDEIKRTIRQTNLDRYGVEYPPQSPIVHDKIKATTLKRYGVEHPTQSPIYKQKSIDTNISRYGEEHPMQSDEIKQRLATTNIERFGVENAFQSPEVRNKIRITNMDRYGKEHFQQQHISDSTMEILQNRDQLEQFFEGKSLKGASHELGINRKTFARYWYGHDLPKFSNSTFENEIAIFLDSLGIPYTRNDRKLISPLELDFYIPDHNIAIEFNGIYWHSSKYLDRDYHRRKYELCRKVGIRLIMINEDEWLGRNDAWRDRLINIFGESKRGLPARKLLIRPIRQSLMNDFCDQHHIQGATSGAIYNIGAFDNDALVAIMAFSKQRGTNDVELIRFCTDGYSHAGLFSRMFKHSIRDTGYTEVLSFADLRHSNGEVYRNNGFTLVGEIRPDYRYTYKHRTYHKSAFTKKKISEKFPDLDMTTMTERQAMEELNIPRIYDCGKLKFIWAG